MLEAKNCRPGAEQYERFVALGKKWAQQTAATRAKEETR